MSNPSAYIGLKRQIRRSPGRAPGKSHKFVVQILSTMLKLAYIPVIPGTGLISTINWRGLLTNWACCLGEVPQVRCSNMFSRCSAMLKLAYIPANPGIGLILTILPINWPGSFTNCELSGRRRIMEQQVTTDRNSRILKEISPRIHQAVTTCRCLILLLPPAKLVCCIQSGFTNPTLTLLN